MKKKNGIFIVFCILLIPLFLGVIYFISNRDSIYVDQKITWADIFNNGISLYSLFLTVILSIIVYHQNDKIAKLETKEYEYFIGVKSVKKTTELGDEIGIIDYSIAHSIISKMYIEDELVNYCNINLIDNIQNADQYLISFIFLVKSKLQICSINLKSISVQLSHLRNHKEGKKIMQQKEYSFSSNYNCLSCCSIDNQEIPLIVGLFSKQISFEEIVLTFCVEIIDSSNLPHFFIITSNVLYDNGMFYLISSKTMEQKKIEK